MLDGTKDPETTTGEFRTAMGQMRDYLGGLLGENRVGFSSEEKEIEAPAGILEMDLLPLSGVVLHRCEE